MKQVVTITEVGIDDDDERLQKIANILAGGVYAYLNKLSLDLTKLQPLAHSVVGLEKAQSGETILDETSRFTSLLR